MARRDDDLDAIAKAMVRIRRRQTRRTLGREAERRHGAPIAMSHIGVIDAIEEGPPEGTDGVTVGDVAVRLGIDPSRASRAVAETIDAGLVLRTVSQRDARRVPLVLTAEGRAVAARVQAARQAMLRDATRDWSERDRAELARLLTRLTDALDAARG